MLKLLQALTSLKQTKNISKVHLVMMYQFPYVSISVSIRENQD